MASKSLIPTYAIISLDLYYLTGKQYKAYFARKSTRKKEILGKYCIFLCYGPTKLKSLGGNRYFVSFVNYPTKKIRVFIWKAKGQVFEHSINVMPK